MTTKRFVAGIFGMFFAAMLFGQQAKVRVAVASLRAGEGVSEAQAQTIREFVEGDLLGTGKFEVIERSQIDSVLKEQGFQATGCTETECAVEMGKILALKYMVLGSLSKLEGQYFLNAKIVDVESAKLVNVKRAQSPTLTGFNEVSKTLAQELASGKSGAEVGGAGAATIGSVEEPGLATNPDWATFQQLMGNISSVNPFKVNYGKFFKPAKKILGKVAKSSGDKDRFFAYWHGRLCQQIAEACAPTGGDRRKFLDLAVENYRESIKRNPYHASSKDAQARIAALQSQPR
jgi:hypothetical protein